jgi:hypothetical protein
MACESWRIRDGDQVKTFYPDLSEPAMEAAIPMEGVQGPKRKFPLGTMGKAKGGKDGAKD